MRVALVGGSRAFGFGMVASAAVAPAMLNRMMLVVDRPGTDPPPLTVVNLGRVGHAAASYPRTIERFAYLRPDSWRLRATSWRRRPRATVESPGLFELTGYMPILPLALREKGFAPAFGSIARGYTGGTISPQPSPIHRAAGFAIQGTGSALMAVDGWLGNAAGRRPKR